MRHGKFVGVLQTVASGEKRVTHRDLSDLQVQITMADNTELESFRREWHEEVARRSTPRSTPSVTSAPQPSRFPPTRHEASHRKKLEEEAPLPASFDSKELSQQFEQLSVELKHDLEEDGFTRGATREPNSALEHFERAVEKEATGNLGDSLQHYRKAYRVSISSKDSKF